jgi:peptidoglycan/xylan/chitin deacetylase (PgdA/CDA1 family)
VLITVDDADADFAEHAWPLLSRHGLGALVSVDVDAIDGHAAGAPDRRALGWDDVRRLHAEGVAFAAHVGGATGLTALPVAEACAALARARAALTRALGAPPAVVTYARGAVDPIVRHLAGGCGYQYGLACGDRHAEFGDPALALPRRVVRGRGGIVTFIRALAG